MTYKALELSSTNIKNMPFENYTRKQFRFIAGNSVMSMNFILADYISPLISKYHQIDPTMEFIYLSKDEQSSNLLSKDIQSVIHRLISGEKVNISNEVSIKLRILFILLENYEIYQDIKKTFPFCIDDLDYPLDFILNFFQYKFKISQFNFQNNDCIEFIATNFYQYEKLKLIKLPKQILFLIISNDKLMIKNEDVLFEFINELFKSNESNIFEIDSESKIDITSFYELIDYNYLSDDKLLKLIQNIKTDQISSQLWLHIQNILTQRLNRENQTNNPLHKCKDKIRRVYCPFNGNEKNRFNGIIKYLTDKFGGNIVDKGVIKVYNLCKCEPYWKSEVQSSYPRAAVRLDDTEKYFDSYVTPKQNDILYLKYDFLDRKVQLDCYSIRSRPDHGKGAGNFMNWFIEGTNDDSDENNWVRLDTRENDHTIDEKRAVNTFHMCYKQNENKYFKLIRIGCIKNSYGNNGSIVFFFPTFSIVAYF